MGQAWEGEGYGEAGRESGLGASAEGWKVHHTGQQGFLFALALAFSL